MSKRGILSVILLAGLVFCMPALAWGGSSVFTPQTMNGGLDSGTAKEWFDKGVELYSQGKYEEAIQAWDEAIKIDPQYAEAWSNKGAALADLGKYDEAIKAFEEAIKIDPKDANAWSNKAKALEKLGRYEEAIKASMESAIRYYDLAIELNSTNAIAAEAWYRKGLVLKDLGRTAEADAAFARAKELGYTGESILPIIEYAQ